MPNINPFLIFDPQQFTVRAAIVMLLLIGARYRYLISAINTCRTRPKTAYKRAEIAAYLDYDKYIRRAYLVWLYFTPQWILMTMNHSEQWPTAGSAAFYIVVWIVSVVHSFWYFQDMRDELLQY